jgi:protein-S-isoprenylcysteine O-methyltransferase Ste14
MNNKMKITGVAPMIAVPTFIYLALAILITYFADNLFRITTQSNTGLIVSGVVLIAVGALVVASCGRKLLKNFEKGILMTDGLYKIFRNPMYAAYLILIIPGVSLLFNSWLALTTIIFNYILFSILIKQEYKYLHEKFGKEYENYLSKVLIKFL